MTWQAAMRSKRASAAFMSPIVVNPFGVEGSGLRVWGSDVGVQGLGVSPRPPLERWAETLGMETLKNDSN